MKALAIALIAVSAVAAVIRPFPGTATLLWTYPESEISTDLVFRVYYQTGGLTLTPLTNWPMLTQTVAQIGVTNYSLKLNWPDPVQATFAMTASNKLGESFFSETDYLPGLVRTNQPFQITVP